MTDIEKELQKQASLYKWKVTTYLELKFNNIVVPYLKQHNLEFISGNGDWGICVTNKTSQSFVDAINLLYLNLIDNEDLPKEIYEFLHTEIICDLIQGAGEVGLCIASYPRKEN